MSKFQFLWFHWLHVNRQQQHADDCIQIFFNYVTLEYFFFLFQACKMSCQNFCVGVLSRQPLAMWHATQRASCAAATMTAGAIAHPASHNATVPLLTSRSWKRTWRRAIRPGAVWTMSSWSQVKSLFWQSDFSGVPCASVSNYTNITYLSILMRVYSTHQELQGSVCNVHSRKWTLTSYRCEIDYSLCWILIFQKIEIKRDYRGWRCIHTHLVYIGILQFVVLSFACLK